ncbi:hypothetical protein LIER_28409 [Lithospermum erythrorhizon]|uniref:CCHC-type domain-containing protein n=1 Tax=Lithospermum erythrorhizon TaxID=34254 RepID=A0AAV3RH76_LITER
MEIGEEMSDSKIVTKILRTLTEQFTYVVVSIEESQNVEEMTVDDLQGSLVMHENKFNRGSREENDQVLQVEDRFNVITSRGRGNYRGRGRGRGRQTPFDKASIECYKCHKLGHFQNECPRWEREAHYASVDEEDDLLLMVEVGDNASRQNVWYIGSVKLGNNDKLEITGKGNMRIKIGNANDTISDVYCVPELKNNLLSVGQF